MVHFSLGEGAEESRFLGGRYHFLALSLARGKYQRGTRIPEEKRYQKMVLFFARRPGRYRGSAVEKSRVVVLFVARQEIFQSTYPFPTGTSLESGLPNSGDSRGSRNPRRKKLPTNGFSLGESTRGVPETPQKKDTKKWYFFSLEDPGRYRGSAEKSREVRYFSSRERKCPELSGPSLEGALLGLAVPFLNASNISIIIGKWVSKRGNPPSKTVLARRVAVRRVAMSAEFRRATDAPGGAGPRGKGARERGSPLALGGPRGPGSPGGESRGLVLFVARRTCPGRRA